MHVGNGSNVPSEVWDYVFKHCERVYKKSELLPVFAPKSRLSPILLVCKEWHIIAERRLYTSISLGSIRAVRDRNGCKKVINGKDVCKRLCATLQKNPRLASLVRELQLGAITLDRGETKNYIRLLDLCENVEILDLGGCAFGLANEVRIALAKTDLISMKLSMHGLPRWLNGERVFSAPGLLAFIQKWPRLETIDASLVQEDCKLIFPSKHPQPTLATAKCHALREVTIRNSHLKPAEILLLADIAPRLGQLSIWAGAECNGALQQCLQTWSSTLKRLDISTSTFNLHLNTKLRYASPIFWPPLVELRELRISSSMAPPSALVYLPKLENLTYKGEYPDGMELAQIIQSGRLPRLREIDVAFSQSLNILEPSDGLHKEMGTEVAKEIAKACESKHILIKGSLSTGDDEPDSPGSVDNDWPELDPWGDEDECRTESSTSDSEGENEGPSVFA